MARKRFSPEQIIGMLREAEFRISYGRKWEYPSGCGSISLRC
jgi:hypothetical protein